jgi:hypothetical protein
MGIAPMMTWVGCLGLVAWACLWVCKYRLQDKSAAAAIVVDLMLDMHASTETRCVKSHQSSNLH